MKQEQLKRLGILLRQILTVLAMGAAYALFAALTGITLPCVFYEITGWYCPGCGLTRMCLALLHLDLAGAARANLLFVVLLPFLLTAGICKAHQYIRTGTVRMGTPETIFWILCAAAALGFGIMRNLSAFAFLQPGG